MLVHVSVIVTNLHYLHCLRIKVISISWNLWKNIEIYSSLICRKKVVLVKKLVGDIFLTTHSQFPYWLTIDARTEWIFPSQINTGSQFFHRLNSLLNHLSVHYFVWWFSLSKKVKQKVVWIKYQGTKRFPHISVKDKQRKWPAN